METKPSNESVPSGISQKVREAFEEAARARLTWARGVLDLNVSPSMDDANYNTYEAALHSLVLVVLEESPDKKRLDRLITEFGKNPNSNGVTILDWGCDSPQRWWIDSDFGDHSRGASLREAIDKLTPGDTPQ